MLREQTLFGPVDLVEKSILRLREFEAQALDLHTDGYWLAFSGGKDSMVILDLAKRAGVKHTAHFNLTTVDPPELLQFIRQHYPAVKWERPRISMFALILKKMMPPTRLVRYCCAELKERGGAGRIVVTGIRWAESLKRSKRQIIEQCRSGNGKSLLNPIIEWTDKDVWQYIRENHLPYCCLYDEGFKRIGCVGCPMAGKDRAREFKRWPQYKRMYLRAFDQIAVTGSAANRKLHWRTGKDVFKWWTSDHHIKEQSDQGVLFE